MKTSILESAIRRAYKVLRGSWLNEAKYPNLEKYILSHFGDDPEYYVEMLDMLPNKELIPRAEKFLQTHNPTNDEIDIDDPEFLKLTKVNPDAKAFRKVILMLDY